MALSQAARDYLVIALSNKRLGAEVADAIDAGGNAQAATVAALGATTNLPATAAVLSTSNTYTDAAVKAAIDGAVTALRAAAETRLDNAEAKIDAVIASLKAAHLMA